MLQEAVTTVESHGAEEGLHRLILEFVHVLQESTEVLSAVIIGAGVAIAIYQLGWMFLTARRKNDREIREGYQKIRLSLSRFLALALEFQLAADVLATTVAPSWDQLGRLGAIAVIRTFLNYFLAREIKEELGERTTAHPSEAA